MKAGDAPTVTAAFTSGKRFNPRPPMKAGDAALTQE